MEKKLERKSLLFRNWIPKKKLINLKDTFDELMQKNRVITKNQDSYSIAKTI